MKLGFGLSFATVIIFVVGLLIGGVGFGSFVQHTSTVDFCTSCHEMRNTVYEEYKKIFLTTIEREVVFILIMPTVCARHVLTATYRMIGAKHLLARSWR